MPVPNFLPLVEAPLRTQEMKKPWLLIKQKSALLAVNVLLCLDLKLKHFCSRTCTSAPDGALCTLLMYMLYVT